MSEKEKAGIQAIAEAVKALGDDIPEEKKQYLLGFAEGIAGMAERQHQPEAQQAGA